MRKMLLSFKPEVYEKIKSRKKKFEHRRNLPDSLGVMPLTDAKLQILLPPVALQDHIHTSHSVLERVRFVL